MRGLYHILMWISLFLLLSTSVFATSVKILAASEEQEIGSVAVAELETKEGTGRVFIQTNLLSQQDTQLSVKMAKEFICTNYADCSDKDFFYTIKTHSQFISGPSGGAAIALLTFAHLHDLEMPDDLSLTGTINSGGYIGTVGGLQQKIRGAGNNDIDKVLIPFGNKYQYTVESQITNTTNSSLNITSHLNDSKIDIVALGEDYDIDVIEVSTFDDILFEIYGIERPTVTVVIPDFYTQKMNEISDSLCEDARISLETIDENIDFYYDYFTLYRTNETENSSQPYIPESTIRSYTNFTYYFNLANSSYNNSRGAILQNDYYSSASFCFSANLQLRYLNFSQQSVNETRIAAENALYAAETIQHTDFQTLNDIQIYAVVEERLTDARDHLETAHKMLLENRYMEAIDNYAYAYERAKTAESWASFYDVPSKPLKNIGSLDQACSLAIQDAETRIQYLKVYYSFPLESEKTLAKAKAAKKNLDNALCIFYSLKAKAEVDSIVSIMGISEDDLIKFLEVKESIASKFVALQYEKGQYPILGYSYLEYGNSLKEANPYSALIYFQMALELSNLDIFLDQDSKNEFTFIRPLFFRKEDFFMFGFAVGLIFSALFLMVLKRKRNNTLK